MGDAQNRERPADDDGAESARPAFLCAVALCAVSGCTKFEAANPSANTTAKSAEECADSDEDQIHFQWKWCGPNVAGTAEIATVCRGTLYFQDMIFEAIKFENADRTKRQCLFNIGGGTTVTRAECMRAVEARYFPMYDESAESIIVVAAKNGAVAFTARIGVLSAADRWPDLAETLTPVSVKAGVPIMPVSGLMTATVPTNPSPGMISSVSFWLE